MKIKHPKVVFLLMLIIVKLTTSTVIGQEVYNSIWITDSEGLPQNSIKSIFKDKYDFIWLSTENGLVRYDGREFKVFNNTNIDGINSNRMWYFEGDPEKDSIYSINSNAHLLLISERKVTKIADSLHPFSTRKPHTKIPFYHSYVAMTASYYEANIYDLKQNFIYKDGMFSVDIDSIYELNIHNEKLYSYYHNFKSKTQYFMFEGGLFELLSNGLISRYKQGEKTPFEFTGKFLSIPKVYKNNVSGHVFVFIDNALYQMTYVLDHKIHLKKIFPDYVFDQFNITSIYYDEKNETLYLGSGTKGLNIIKKHPFKTISTAGPYNNNVEYAVLRANDSTILTGSGAVIKGEELLKTNDFQETSSKYHIQLDRKENLWVKKDDKIYKYLTNNNLIFSNPTYWQTEEGVVINTIEQKNDEEMWFSTVKFITEEGALYTAKIDETDILPQKILETDFSISTILSLDEDKILLGSNNGLFKVTNYKETPKFESIIDSIDVRSVLKDGERIWITSYNQGFFLYENSKITNFPQDRNNYLTTSHCMLEDKNGFFWITTNKGLFQVFKDNLISYAEGKTENIYYQYYDKSYGLTINEFNGGCVPCGAQLADDSIYFPTLLGIVSFNPNQLTYSTITEEIYIDEIEVDGKRTFFKDKITVDRNFERLRFFVSSPYYENSYNLHIEVKLESETPQSWIPLDNDQSISFTKLPPGKYKLTARKLSGFDFKYQYKTIDLIIPPAFWQTLWFKISAVLIGILLILLAIRMRFRYIQLQNVALANEVAEQTKQLRNLVETLTETKEDLKKQLWFQKNMINSISHDLKTPMKYLTMTSKHLYDSHDKRRLDEFENIELIYNSSSQILHFIDKLLIYAKANINDISDTEEHLQLQNLVEECLSIFEIAAKTNETKIQNKITKGVFVKTNRQLLKVVLQNLIDNAIKNCPKGVVTIDTIVTKHEFIITVEDNGTGMNEDTLLAYKNLFTNKIHGSDDNQFSGLGLKIIHELLSILRAKLDLHSLRGKGTIFKIILQR